MIESTSDPNAGTTASPPGQGLTEFAIVLPVLLALVLGIIEFGRLMVAISSLSTASRDAVRYAVSVGETPGGVPHYQDCLGIRDAAHRVSVFADPKIVITYDVDGPGATSPVEYCQVGITVDPITVELGMQISVQVADDFEPLNAIIQLPTIPLQSETTRTVLRDVYVK